jgi:hypothetical protein
MIPRGLVGAGGRKPGPLLVLLVLAAAGPAVTVVAWFLVPLVRIDRVEVKARAGAVEATVRSRT